MRRFAFFAALFVALFVSASARATAEFPALIQQHLNITCTDGGTATPDCIICHQNDNGGLGTATRPFGAWMKSNGLSAFNDSELETLLDKAKSEGVDTNCDGIPDIIELEDCDWPALETSGDACGDAGTSSAVTILYGCSAAPNAASPSGDPLPASAAIGVAFALAGALVIARISRRKKRA